MKLIHCKSEVKREFLDEQQEQWKVDGWGENVALGYSVFMGLISKNSPTPQNWIEGFNIPYCLQLKKQNQGNQICTQLFIGFPGINSISAWIK